MAKEKDIRDIEVVGAEEVVKEKKYTAAGEYFYLNDLPKDERSEIIRAVVESQMQDYVDPTAGMTEKEMIEFDKAMKQAIKDMYGNWEKDLPSDVHHIDELEQNEDNPHDS